jgi:hypothetical protein
VLKSLSSAGGMTPAASAAMAGASVGRDWPARSSTAGGSPPVLGRLARRGELQLAEYERISILERPTQLEGNSTYWRWRVDIVETEKGGGMGEGKSGERCGVKRSDERLVRKCGRR